MFWTIILPITITICYAVHLCIDDPFCYNWFITRVIKTILAIIVSYFVILVICAMVGCSIGVFIYTCQPNTPVLVERVELKALSYNTETKASFFVGLFIGGGEKSTERKYYYVAKREHGYKIESKDIDNCYINYTNEQPYLALYEKQALNKDDFWVKMFGIDWIKPAIYELYVPDGSVIENYKVDIGS